MISECALNCPTDWIPCYTRTNLHSKRCQLCVTTVTVPGCFFFKIHRRILLFNFLVDEYIGILCLQGETGKLGGTGSQGQKGEVGDLIIPPSRIGPKGSKGLSGIPGRQGINGPAGSPGSRGPHGPAGPNGFKVGHTHRAG